MMLFGLVRSVASNNLCEVDISLSSKLISGDWLPLSRFDWYLHLFEMESHEFLDFHDDRTALAVKLRSFSI